MKARISGVKLKAARARAGLAVGDVAGVLNVSREIVYAWENDQRDMRAEHLECLVHLYRCARYDLVKDP